MSCHTERNTGAELRGRRRNVFIAYSAATNAIHAIKLLFGLSTIIATVAGMPVNSVLFPASTVSTAADVKIPPPSPTTTSSRSIVVFIHGRLEADPAHDSTTGNSILKIPRPAVLYSDFCNGLAATLKRDVLLVDYHDCYNDWGSEPRDLGLGPVTSAVGEAIRKHVSELSSSSQGPISNHNGGPVIATETATCTKITLISFSMGAAIVLKLLKSDPMFETVASSFKNGVEVERVVLVEPVWRCWLPFAVSRAAEARYSPSSGKSVEISTVAALALVGTNDGEVRVDSGGGMGGSSNSNLGRVVARSLQPFLPNLSAVDIEGGNHFGLCSGPPELLDFAGVGLSADKSPENIRKELIDRILEFCDDK